MQHVQPGTQDTSGSGTAIDAEGSGQVEGRDPTDAAVQDRPAAEHDGPEAPSSETREKRLDARDSTAGRSAAANHPAAFSDTGRATTERAESPSAGEGVRHLRQESSEPAREAEPQHAESHLAESGIARPESADGHGAAHHSPTADSAPPARTALDTATAPHEPATAESARHDSISRSSPALISRDEAPASAIPAPQHTISGSTSPGAEHTDPSELSAARDGDARHRPESDAGTSPTTPREPAHVDGPAAPEHAPHEQGDTVQSAPHEQDGRVRTESREQDDGDGTTRQERSGTERSAPEQSADSSRAQPSTRVNRSSESPTTPDMTSPLPSHSHSTSSGAAPNTTTGRDASTTAPGAGTTSGTARDSHPRPITSGDPAGSGTRRPATTSTASDVGSAPQGQRRTQPDIPAPPQRAHLREERTPELAPRTGSSALPHTRERNDAPGSELPARPERAHLPGSDGTEHIELRDLTRDADAAREGDDSARVHDDSAREPDSTPHTAVQLPGEVVIDVDGAPPREGPVTERTQRLRDLVRHNAVIADVVDGTAVRADARAALRQADVPAARIERLLDGLSDIALKDDFKVLTQEGLRLRTGQGADAVEVHVRLRPGDDTSPDASPEPTSGKQDFAHGTDAVAGGSYSKDAGDGQSGPRRDGGFNHYLSLPPPTGTSNPHRTIDPSFGFRGATPQPSWAHSDSTELEHSASYTPPNKWSGSTHDLEHDLVVHRADVSTARSGTQRGGAKLTTPEVLTEVDVAEAKASGGPRATFVRGDQGLFDALTELVGGHPQWTAATGAINSPVRNDLLELTGGKSLSHLGNDVLDGSTLTKALETHNSAGHRRTAQVEIRFRQGNSRGFAAPPQTADGSQPRPSTSSGYGPDPDAADEPGQTMLTEQGRGYKNETSHTTGSAQPFNVNAGLGLGFTWSLFDKPGTRPAQPSYIHGDRLDLRLDGLAFRSSGANLSTVRTVENTAATTWFGSGRLHGVASDLTYDLVVRFDDGQIRRAGHHVPEGATTWSLAESGGTEKPADDPGRLAEDNTAPFSPHRVIGAAETHFPNADGLRDAIRDRLPANVLRDESGAAGNVRASDNEVALSYFTSARGLLSHSPALNGDGMSFLLNRGTHAGTGTPDDFVRVLVRAVPRTEDASSGDETGPAAADGSDSRSSAERRYTQENDRSRDGSGWEDTTLRGELQAKSRIDHSETVRGATTVGGSSGVRAGIGAWRINRTLEFTGGYNRSFGSEQHNLDSSSGQGRGFGWAGKEFSSHHRQIDYEVTVRGKDLAGSFVVGGGTATTYRSGRTELTERAAEGNSGYRPVDHDAPVRPEGWAPAALPDHFAVHGLDLPAGRADRLSGDLLGKHPDGSPVAEQQVHAFTGEDKVAVNLDRATTGTYTTPVHRYAEGEWLGFRNRLGDAAMHVALSNPRVSGPPTKMTLTFIGKSTGSTGHGSEHGRTDYTFGNGRMSVAPIKQFYLLPQTGYGYARNDSEGTSVKQEHEHTTTTTYDGPAYLVTYDTTTLLSGRDVDHTGVGPYDGRDLGDWKHAEAHRRDSVQVWVPAREIGQVGLPPGWDEGHDRGNGTTDQDGAGGGDRADGEDAGPASDDRPAPALVLDGHASPSIRPEVTERLVSQIKDSLLRVPRAEVPQTTLARFARFLTSGIADGAGRVVYGSGPMVAAENLAQQVIGEVSPRGLSALLPDLVGLGKEWSTSVDGPLGSSRVSLLLRARLGEGRFDGTDEGWSDNHQAKAMTTTGRVVSSSRSHNGNFSLRTPIYTDAQIARSVGAGAMTTGSAADTRKRTEESVTERTTSQFTSGDIAWFSHPIELELEVRRTAHANHAARSLTGGLVDRVMPGVDVRTPRVDPIPDAVRSYHPAGESAPGEREQQPVTGFPDAHYSRVGGRSIAGVVRDLLDGVPAGERTGQAAPPVPPEATSARQAINTGANPAALSAHLPEALGDGYRVDGLDHDGRYRTAFGQRHPLRSLTFQARLEQARVTPAGYTPLEGLEINKAEVAKSSVDDERTSGPMWNTLMASAPLTLFPRPTAGSSFEPGTALTEMGEVRGSGPALTWQRTDTANLSGKKTEDIRLSDGEVYLVEARALWTITPAYRGDVPPEWTVGRTARDTVHVRTDENGLRAMGLAPPPKDEDGSDGGSEIFFDAVSEIDGHEPSDTASQHDDDVFYDARSEPEAPERQRPPGSELEHFLAPER